jgi:hypothetical protein
MSKTNILDILDRYLSSCRGWPCHSPDDLSREAPKLGDEEWEEFEKEKIEELKKDLRRCRCEVLQKRTEYEKRLKRINREIEISGISGVKREGNQILIEGSLAKYKIDILTNKVEGSCKGGHKSKHLCLEVGKGGNVDPAVGLAMNLRYDDWVEKADFLEKIEELVLCPSCLVEEVSCGKVSKGFLERIKKYSQQKEKFAEKPPRVRRREAFPERRHLDERDIEMLRKEIECIQGEIMYCQHRREKYEMELRDRQRFLMEKKRSLEEALRNIERRGT